jgi:hypothetical protein
MKDSQKDYLIAVLTVRLKHEMLQRAGEMGIDNIIEAPSLEEIKDELPDEVWSRIEMLYDTGQYRSVYPYINKLINEADPSCSKILYRF